MIKRYSGKIEFGDGYRCSGEPDILDGTVHIGGVDVIEDLDGAFPPGSTVTVGLADERFEGEFALEMGWGYSEYTPVECDSLIVGENNILNILGTRFNDGDSVTLWVADEPVNLAEER